MTRLWGIIAVFALAVPLSVQAEGPRPVGLIFDASQVTNPLPFVRFVDLMVESLAGSRKWEPTVLTADSPLVRAGGATWPATTGDWLTQEATLVALLTATRLTDLLVVVPQPSRENSLEVLWLQTGSSPMRQLSLTAAGTGEAALTTFSKQLLARLEAGHATAAVASLPPALAPATPLPSPPEAPTAPTVADTPPAAAVAVSPPVATADPTAAPQPATPATPAGELTRPTVTAGAPQAAVTKPETTHARPAPPQPQAAPPTTAPTAPAAPAAPTPPVAPAEPQPTPPSAHLVAAEKHLAEGDFKKTEQALLQALDAGDSKASVYYLTARLEAARQNVTAERTWLQRTLVEDPANMPAHLRLAELLRRAGLWRKAVDEYQIVLAAEPTNLHAYLGLSALYAGQSQPKRAAEILAQALEHHTEDASLYLRLGDLHTQRRALAEAEAAYDRAARLSEGTARAEALERLGDLYVSADRHHEGFICYAEASKLRSGESSTLTEKRYQQIMVTADAALARSLNAAAETLRDYLGGKNVVREEAFRAMSDFNSEAQEVSKFVDTIMPPGSLKLMHAERKLAYSLAAEAAYHGLEYLDRGAADQLESFQLRLQEARLSLQGLSKPKGR